MPNLTKEALTAYLSTLYGKPVRVHSASEHGKQELAGDLKGFGYGTPVFIEFDIAGVNKKAVLETMSPSSFGHDHFSDRAQTVLWEHSCFNNLPRHVRSIDSGAFLDTGALLSTGKAEEFFLLTEFIDGQGYFKDLDRIRETGKALDEDFARCKALSDYLAEVHAKKHSSPVLYTRRIRDLLGHGECIMGLIDNYPKRYEFINQELLKRIELSCAEWRWRIKGRQHRLCQVHGDFHPWNILFREGTDFSVLDRSRGEWGEPADDVTCLTTNYLFSSILHSGKLEDAFEKLFVLFWENYLKNTGDHELLEVAAPFYAWRGLVVASPVWYPRLPIGVRKTVFNFIVNVLKAERFDFTAMNKYLEDGS